MDNETPKVGLYSEQHALHLAMLRFKDDQLSATKNNFNAKISILPDGKIIADATGDKETAGAPKHVTCIYKCTKTGEEREVTGAINPKRYATPEDLGLAIDTYFDMWRDAKIVSGVCTFLRPGRNYLEVMLKHGIDAEDINMALTKDKDKAAAILTRRAPTNEEMTAIAQKPTKKGPGNKPPGM